MHGGGKAGDIAIAVDAARGGAELTVRVFEWLEPGSPGYNVGPNESSPLGNPDPDDCPNNALAPNGGCWDLVPASDSAVIATINYDGDFGQSKNVTTNDPEDVDDEITAEFPSVVCERVTGGNNTQCRIKPNLPQRGFVEIAVNLTELDLEPEGCQGFGTMWTETRASDSLLSQLKDITEMESLVPVCSTILTKQASPTTVHVGEDVTYTYTEENDGTVPLFNVSVTDDKCSPVNPVLDGGHNVGDDNDNDDLDPGEVWEFACPLTITSAMGNSITNTAIGHAIDPLGFDVTWNQTDCSATGDLLNTPDRFCDEDEMAQATVVVLDPGTSLTKEAAVTITYLYQETNDGGEDLVAPIYVEDDNCSPVTDLDISPADGYNDGDTNTDDILNVGETWVFVCTTSISAFLSAGDSLQMINIAIGHAIDTLGFDVTWAEGCVSTGDLLTDIFCDMDEEAGLQIDIDVSDPLAP
ncbi:MAG: hypothetical protein IIA44_13140 [Acidobacteria bacterium]|nr:hypothetical protein [Acidobacteriota bacterium]